VSGEPIQRLILELARLPGIGERSAARLAFYILRNSVDTGVGRSAQSANRIAQDLAQALLDASEKVGMCDRCFNFCADARCTVCGDSRRDERVICVVEGVADLRAIEAGGAFRGVYHVLHGALAPLDGIGPDNLKIGELLRRIEKGGVEEIILATNTDVEGDATALYIAKLVHPLGVRTTRLASGVPMGGELEYLDQATVARALADRRDFG